MTSKPSPVSFIGVLFKNVGSLMSGSLSVIFTVIGLYLNGKHARAAFFGFAVLCALIAAYRVWSNERQERIRAEEYLVGPDLRIQLHRCYRWTGGGGPFLLLELTVTNHSTGTATVARFDCYISMPDGTRIKDGGWTTVDPTSLFRVKDIGTGNESTENRVTPDLAALMSDFALPRAQHLYGFLEFYVPQLPSENGEVDLEVQITDALGKEHIERRMVFYIADGWFGAQVSQAFKTPRS